MKFNLKEDNKSINSIVETIEQLIVKLKKEEKINSEYLEIIESIFNQYIIQWMEDYLLSKDPDDSINQVIEDEILDLLSILLKLKKGLHELKIGDRVSYIREVTAGKIPAYGFIKQIKGNKALVDKDQGMNARKDWVRLSELKKCNF